MLAHCMSMLQFQFHQEIAEFTGCTSTFKLNNATLSSAELLSLSNNIIIFCMFLKEFEYKCRKIKVTLNSSEAPVPDEHTS